MGDFWEELQRPAPATACVGGVEIGRGSRVRLRPRAGRDPWDSALAGRAAVVHAIEEDLEGGVHVVVVVEDDPGSQRFFFAPDELEAVAQRRVLVAGIGNVFFGDDGFGCEVARRLAGAVLPAGVDVVDFGIRGMDLAYALASYDAVVLVDAAPRGEAPGTLSLVEPKLDAGEPAIETHAMDPVRVLRLARELGRVPPTLLLACEPARADSEDVVVELSPPVRAAVDEAVQLLRPLLEELLQEGEPR
jgi:hydrogenase maturation protease